MDWYYVRGRERVGPMDDETFGQRVKEGVVSSETLVWNSHLPDWKPYGQVTGEVAETTAAPASSAVLATCVECGKDHSVTDMLVYRGIPVCGNCKAIYFQRLLQGTPRSVGVEYGGFWVRFGAEMVDYVLFGAMVAPLQTLVLLTMAINPFLYMGLSILFGLANFAFMIFLGTYFVGTWGASPGKMALGLRIVVADGSKVSYARAFGRVFAKMVSAVILYVGFIMVAFDPERRALHDYMCNTRVIRL